MLPFYLYELTLGYIENVFNNESVIMAFNVPNVHEGLGGDAKDGRFCQAVTYNITRGLPGVV